jgi:hypothetical protein
MAMKALKNMLLMRYKGAFWKRKEEQVQNFFENKLIDYRVYFTVFVTFTAIN